MNDLHEKELNRLVYEALGRASMCWNPRPSTQVFESTEAAAIGAEVVARIKALFAAEERFGATTTTRPPLQEHELGKGFAIPPVVDFDDSDPNYIPGSAFLDNAGQLTQRMQRANEQARRDSEAGIKSPFVIQGEAIRDGKA